MNCPTDEMLFAEWQRAQRHEPLHYQAHLADCRRCRDRFHALDALQRTLAATLETADGDHIDPMTQGAFAEGRLSPAARAQVQDHLVQCADCRRSITALAELVRPARRPWWAALARPALGWGGWVAAGALSIALMVSIGLLPSPWSPGVAIRGGRGPQTLPPDQAALEQAYQDGYQAGRRDTMEALLTTRDPDACDEWIAAARWSHEAYQHAHGGRTDRWHETVIRHFEQVKASLAARP